MEPRRSSSVSDTDAKIVEELVARLPPPKNRARSWAWWILTRGGLLLLVVFVFCYLAFLFAPAPYAALLRWWPTEALGVVRFEEPTEAICERLTSRVCKALVHSENFPAACSRPDRFCAKGWVRVLHHGLYYGGEGLYGILYPLVGWVVEEAHRWAVG